MGAVKIVIKTNTYRDSLILMKISNTIREMDGIKSCSVLLASEQNKTTLVGEHLLTEEVKKAGPNDLLIVVDAETKEIAEVAYEKIELMLSKGRLISANPDDSCRTVEEAIEKMPGANLALLSIPGKYVKKEAMKILEKGINLHIFSDNVPFEEELQLKQYARQNGLIVMGPDCGTANISGCALAFANKVRKGPIGLVGAAGTGIQEVSTLIHRWGSGVSHAIGTGSNDIKNEIGGITTIDGLKKLDSDSETKIIVIVCKPPAVETEKEILKVVQQCSKPVVVNFLGGDLEAASQYGGIPARTLEEAAWKAVNLVKTSGGILPIFTGNTEEIIAQAQKEWSRLNDAQKYIRGTYSGGTLANEACLITSDYFDSVHINTSLRFASRLADTSKSIGHTFIDLADDEFTVGKPHVMAEPAMRFDRILQEANDPETAVLLMDIVIGYGVHQDPAGAVFSTLMKAKALASSSGRYLPIIASICGIDEDPQSRALQANKLRGAGVIVMPTNAQAARIAVMIAKRSTEQVLKGGAENE